MSKAPFKDRRNDLRKVYDPAGILHTLSFTNAHEMVRHSGWTFAAPLGATAASVQSTPAALVPPAVVVAPKDGLAELQALGKETLRRAAAALRVDVDGRATAERLIGAIEATIDKRLTESGDLDGAYADDLNDSPEDIARKTALAEARRRRAYKLEADKHEQTFGDATTIVLFVREAAEIEA